MDAKFIMSFQTVRQIERESGIDRNRNRKRNKYRNRQTETEADRETKAAKEV
jgi:hypothetical protein